jgi:hypothetical protein
MKAEDLYHILHRQPFQPFRVRLKDGRSYDVCHERLAIVGVTFLQIGVPLPDQPDPAPLYDYVETLDLADITGVEALGAAAPTPT